MPFQLDNYDVLILKALLKDGRKSFREISRETGITTPTVKARFDFEMADEEKRMEAEPLQEVKNRTSKAIGNEDQNMSNTIYNVSNTT